MLFSLASATTMEYGYICSLDVLKGPGLLLDFLCSKLFMHTQIRGWSLLLISGPDNQIRISLVSILPIVWYWLWNTLEYPWTTALAQGVTLISLSMVLVSTATFIVSTMNELQEEEDGLLKYATIHWKDGRFG